MDLKVIPFIHLKIRGKKKEYAQKHLTDVCAHCPQSRKLTRDANGDGTCWWFENWNNENYDIPADFGLINLLRFYSGSETKLDAYVKVNIPVQSMEDYGSEPNGSSKSNPRKRR